MQFIEKGPAENRDRLLDSVIGGPVKNIKKRKGIECEKIRNNFYYGDSDEDEKSNNYSDGTGSNRLC